jgi:hypothetical protein
MPFIVNRLIEAVDPVKLYEYIAFGLPSLAPRYAETERFVPFVNLYNDTDDAITITETLLAKSYSEKSVENREKFLLANSWKKRSTQISDAIAKLTT